MTVKVENTIIPPITAGSNKYWISKDKTANISATYSSTYEANSGTGNYVIASPRTISITSKLSGYTINWTSALSLYGTYFTGSNYTPGARRVAYTKLDGTTGYINPFQSSGSVVIKKGTPLVLQMISSGTASLLWWGNNNNFDYAYGGKSGTLFQKAWTPPESRTIARDHYEQSISRWSIKQWPY